VAVVLDPEVEDVPHLVMTTAVVGVTTTEIVVADADGTVAKTISVEERSFFTLVCGGCGHRWQIVGCRIDDLSGTDITEEEECPGCHEVFPVLRE
jgi:hypothetical protein